MVQTLGLVFLLIKFKQRIQMNNIDWQNCSEFNSAHFDIKMSNKLIMIKLNR